MAGNQQAGGWPYAQGGQQSGPGAYPGGYPGMQGQPYGQQPNGQPHQPHYYHGIDLNDPNQNPLYGHWDSYAIISFILALFFPVPVLSALMGAVAMWRTRTFHMKGFGLAVAAVVINVLYTIAVIWMAFNGYDAMSLYQEALHATDRRHRLLLRLHLRISSVHIPTHPLHKYAIVCIIAYTHPKKHQ